MKFVETPLAGLLVIELDRLVDERGFFARAYCEDEFAARGLHTSWPQMNVSFNEKAGTLRGMHFQRSPHEEPKIVRCTRGRILDVAVDLREASPSLHRWFGVVLDAEERNALYIPAGFAHGFQTLEPACEVTYQMGEKYRAEAGDGLRWDSPAIGIGWPLPAPTLSSRDAALPQLVPLRQA